MTDNCSNEQSKFSKCLTSKIIAVKVTSIADNDGKSRSETFNLHADPLRKESEYFQKLLDSDFLEGNCGVVELDDVDPDLFGFFSKFLYFEDWAPGNQEQTARPLFYMAPETAPNSSSFASPIASPNYGNKNKRKYRHSEGGAESQSVTKVSRKTPSNAQKHDYVTLAALYALGERLVASRFQALALFRFTQSFTTFEFDATNLADILRIVGKDLPQRREESGLRAFVFNYVYGLIDSLRTKQEFRDVMEEVPDLARWILSSSPNAQVIKDVAKDKSRFLLESFEGHEELLNEQPGANVPKFNWDFHFNTSTKFP